MVTWSLTWGMTLSTTTLTMIRRITMTLILRRVRTMSILTMVCWTMSLKTRWRPGTTTRRRVMTTLEVEGVLAAAPVSPRWFV